MNEISQHFSDFRKTMPRRVQWLLLIAAFVVVVILLTLLLGGSKTEPVKNIGTEKLELKIIPDTVDWGLTTVGDTQTQTLDISATGPAKITKIRFSEHVAGLTQKQ